jgi:hypothetical protein
MMTRTTFAIAIALQFLTAPVMAQGASDKDSNAHHYQGGPQTGVPRLAKHPKTSNANAQARTTGGHHYSGGPKTESHHMGEKQ